MKPAEVAVAAAVRSHRALFIAATALLAVGTSRLADAAQDWGSWLLTLGAAVIMYVSDLCGEIDRDSAQLARSTSKPAKKARVDMFDSSAPRGTFASLVVGSLMIAAGLIASALCV